MWFMGVDGMHMGVVVGHNSVGHQRADISISEEVGCQIVN